MTNDKFALMEQIQKQRFLPITDRTDSLYEQYYTLIDAHNPDELSFLLFHRGEYYFRIGNFELALNHLTRCLSAPKQDSFRYLDALSYNIIGLIYSLLELHHISLSYLLRYKSICSELQIARETAICNANLSLIYSELDSYDIAVELLDKAICCAPDSRESDYNLRLIFHACRGSLYCKMGDKSSALAAYRTTRAMQQETHADFYEPAVSNFYIRIAYLLKDHALLQENLQNLLMCDARASTFLEVSHFYFNICRFFLEHRMQAESKAILDLIEASAARLPICCLTYRQLISRATYARLFSSEDEYLDVCDTIMALHPRYALEQHRAKLYSLDYMEHLHRTKSDSKMYLEKSRLDPLTGLLNKYTIQFLVEENLTKLTPERRSAMLLLDLDHFKQINDTLGHLIGDSVIQQTASVIRNFFKDSALCGRIGGDEFLVYFNDVPDRSLLILQAEILRQEISSDASRQNIDTKTQVSIGIALSSEQCRTYKSLFEAADKALYLAKTDGRNRVAVLD